MHRWALSLTIGLFVCVSADVQAAPGDLDPTFSGDGIATAPLATWAGYGSGATVAHAIAVQQDGKAVVLGPTQFGYCHGVFCDEVVPKLVEL